MSACYAGADPIAERTHHLDAARAAAQRIKSARALSRSSARAGRPGRRPAEPARSSAS